MYFKPTVIDLSLSGNLRDDAQLREQLEITKDHVGFDLVGLRYEKDKIKMLPDYPDYKDIMLERGTFKMSKGREFQYIYNSAELTFPTVECLDRIKINILFIQNKFGTVQLSCSFNSHGHKNWVYPRDILIIREKSIVITLIK